jgi:hypothetical protein
MARRSSPLPPTQRLRCKHVRLWRICHGVYTHSWGEPRAKAQNGPHTCGLCFRTEPTDSLRYSTTLHTLVHGHLTRIKRHATLWFSGTPTAQLALLASRSAAQPLLAWSSRCVSEEMRHAGRKAAFARAVGTSQAQAASAAPHSAPPPHDMYFTVICAHLPQAGCKGVTSGAVCPVRAWRALRAANGCRNNA